MTDYSACCLFSDSSSLTSSAWLASLTISSTRILPSVPRGYYCVKESEQSRQNAKCGNKELNKILPLTCVSGKVAYKLLNALLAQGIFKVHCCSCNFLWRHFAIMIPGHYSINMISKLRVRRERKIKNHREVGFQYQL